MLNSEWIRPGDISVNEPTGIVNRIAVYSKELQR